MIMADPTFLNGSNQETSLVLSTTPITSRKECCSKIEKALEEVTLMRVVDPKVNSHHQVAPFLSLLTPFTNVTVYSWQPDTHNPSLAFGRDRSLINQVQAGVMNISSYLLPAQGDRCLGEGKLAWSYSRSHHPETNWQLRKRFPHTKHPKKLNIPGMKSDEKRVQALEAESTIAVQGRKHPKTPGSKLLSLKRSKKTQSPTDTHSLSLALALSEEEEVVELRVYRLKTQTEHIIHNAGNKHPVLHTHDPKSIQAPARGCATAPQKRDLPECQTSTLPAP
jgi:hypothetical protein